MSSNMKENDLLVPTALHWTKEDVANWIEELGFPQYRDCFISNLIDGRKLIISDASFLPRYGITDFEHILFITASIRELLGIDKLYWNRSIADSPGTPMEMFLQIKSRTGRKADKLSYSQFLKRSFN